MVDRLTGPGGQEENQSTESNPRQESALQKHLRRLGILGEAKKDTTESDDDDDESDKPKKKFRKFFKGLFRNVVEPPESQDPDAPKRSGLESLFFGWGEPEASPTPETIVKDEAREPLIKTGSEPVIDQAPDVVEQPIAYDITEEVRKVPPYENTELSDDDRTEASVPAVDPEFAILPVQSDMTRELPVNPTVFERSNNQPAEKEVVIERGPGIALPVVLVGAEYFARKRADRKLDTKFSEKTETLGRGAKQGDTAREQLDTLVQQNREQLEKLKLERQPVLERRSIPEVEKPQSEIIQPKQKFEQVTPVEAPKPQIRAERIEPAAQEKDVARKEQYRIMKQVADAAEHDIPVEKAFERSHEVKDDMSMPSSATSIGAIMAAQAEEQRRVVGVQAVQRQMGDATQGLPVINETRASDMYPQAMKRGFWSALVIIILGIITYLVK